MGFAIIIIVIYIIIDIFGAIGKKAKFNALERIIDITVETNKDVLYRKYKQTHYIDDYGRISSSGWDREINYYIKNILEPEYNSKTGYKFSTLKVNKKWVKQKIDNAMLDIQEEINSNKKRIKTKKQTKKIKTGVDYERYVEGILQQNDYQVMETPTTGDQGVDLIATKNDIRIAIQCKFYSKPVGNKAVQEVATGKEFYDCEYACVVSNNTYTLSAKKLASASNVLLFNEGNIIGGLNEIVSDYTSDKIKYDDENSEDEELLFTDLTDENDSIKIK